jgi:nucleoside-diphosphate-sugar epimerase
MKVLATGTTGFVGQSFYSKAINNKSFELKRIVRKSTGSSDELIGDLNNIIDLESQINEFKPDVLLHMAWQGIPDLGRENSILNLENSIQLFNLAVKCGVKKVIVTGSCFEYDLKEGICSEDKDTGASDFFPWAKDSLHTYLQVLALNENIEFNWLRIFYVYGPGQRSGSLLPFLVSNYMKGEVPGVRTPEDSNDFVYVDDVVDAMLSCIEEKVPSGSYNVCSGEVIKVRDICDLMATEFDMINTEWNKQEEIKSFFGDYSKLNGITGWKPTTSVQDGIKKYVEWYKTIV